MNQVFESAILKSTGATSFYEIETIQSLWRGYGRIVRLGLEGCDLKTVVIKHVQLPVNDKHPKGWNTDVSHNRKIKSYQVETEWYKLLNDNCTKACKTPLCLVLESYQDEILIVLEDLDKSGFSDRKSTVEWENLEACLKWLANFHATFMNTEPKGLWGVGTYWHLDTRPDELEVLDDIALKNSASKIDKLLNNCKYMTLVHGDAKLANFCFSESGTEVAAVDFQYVGRGCGMKDLAYFIGSCFGEEESERYEPRILKFYFAELKNALTQTDINCTELEKEWRLMFPVAWADFHRFMKGWSPGHWKINSYSEKMVRQVVDRLNLHE